jgi:hypothetical protein
MTIPAYTLIDAIGWLTTRSIPLSTQAITDTQYIVNNTPEFSGFIMRFVGSTTPENSMSFRQPLSDISNNQNFFDAAQQVTVPNTIRTLLDQIQFDDGQGMTQENIDDIFSILAITPQFSPYVTQLSGITSVNFRGYMGVFVELCTLPKFDIDAVGYPA